MMDNRVNGSGGSEDEGGWREARWGFTYTLSSGTSLSNIESASPDWDECRLDSTRVLSSGTVSTADLGSASELVLVGEGNAVSSSSRSR